MLIRRLRSVLFPVLFVTAAVQASAQPLITVASPIPDVVIAPSGADVAVTVTGGPALPTDWVGLYAIDTPDNQGSLVWQYLNGLQTPPTSGVASATLTFQAPLTAGLYQFRFFRNNTYERLAVSDAVTVFAADRELLVNGDGFPKVVAGTAGTTVIVDAQNGPANVRDWVGMYPIGAPVGQAALDWMYLNGTKTPPTQGVHSAALTFTLPLVGGAYEFRFYENDTYTLLATSTVVDVSAPAKLTINGVDPPTSVGVQTGSAVVVGVSGGPANPTDWVGLYQAGAADANRLAWKYLNGTTTPPASGVSAADLTFTAPTTAGTYEFRFFIADTYGRLATSAPLAVSVPTAQITVNGVAPPAVLSAAPSTTVSVQISNGPGGVYDWVAMAATTAANTSYISWKYLNGLTTAPAQGLTSATLSFTLPATAGSYEFRFFANNGYTRLATSSRVDVASSGVSIVLLQPVTGASFVSPSSLTLAASVSTNNRTVTQVQFFTGSTVIGTDTASPYQISWAAPPHGSHALTAVATDSTSATTTSAVVNITVTGTLAMPTVVPVSGTYPPGQTVTLAGPSGAEIRYTTDGTVPSATSSLYSGPLTLTQTTVLKARAFQSAWVTSAALVASYTIDGLGPTIAASYNPTRNSNNWNTTPVVISFTCSDPAGVSSCPTSATFTSEGASQTVNVTATDTAGNVTNQTFTVSIDMTAPTTAISAPANASTTSDTSVAVTATVSDSLSGVQSATCNGAAATVTGANMACTVSLAKGENSVVVHTTDLAGNSRSASVRMTRTGTATAIVMAPSTHTLLVGETRVLKALDDFGQPLSGLTWASSNTDIATVDATGMVTGVSAGQATVTAAGGSLTKDIAILVSGTSLALGTTRWVVDPFPGYAHATSIGINGFEAAVASVEILLDSSGTAVGTVARAFETSGRQTSAVSVPLLSGERVVRVLGSAHGGIVLLVSAAPYTVNGVYSLIGVGLAADDPAPWRYSPLKGRGVPTGLAQASDGTIFAISGGSIIGINGSTGARVFEVATPASTFERISVNCPQSAGRWSGWANIATSITVDADDNASVLFIRTDATQDWGLQDCYHYSTNNVIHAEVKLYRVSPTGSASVVELHEYNETNAMFPMPSSLKPLPDEQGGVLAVWQVCHYPGDFSDCETRARHVTGTTAGTEYGLPYESGLPTIAASGRVAYHGGPNIVKRNMVDGTALWSAAIPGTPVVATEDGRVEVWTSTGRTVLDSSGNVVTTGGPIGMTAVATTAESRIGTRYTEPKLIDVADEPLFEDHASYAIAQSVAEGRRTGTAQSPGTTGIFLRTYVVTATAIFRHAAVYMYPRDQDRWTTNPFQPHSQENYRFATIGGQPSIDPCFGNLLGVPNRPDDREGGNTPIYFYRINHRKNENDLIEELLQRNVNYGSNGSPVSYSCAPTAEGNDYNSNSYAHGLLKAVDSPVPTLMGGSLLYPGWQKPLPTSYFQHP